MSLHHARKFSKCGRWSQSHRVFRLITGLSTAAILAAGFVTLNPQLALASGVVLVNEPFTGTTTASSEWVLPSAPSGTNVACMTASTATSQTPIPGCGPPADSSGSGALRLTADSTGEEGGVAYGLSVPSSDGIDAIFDSYQYGTTNGADGIGFFLAAANPSNPQPPSAIGQPGGDLGYSADGSAHSGMTYGYLGVGLDVYGNYATTSGEGTGCTSDPTWVTSGTHSSPKSGVTVRGPGNGTVGYCALTSTYSTDTTENLDGGGSGTRSSSAVPVEVVINPSGSSVTVAATTTLTPHNFSSFTVSANSYQVEFIPIGSSSAQILTGALPNASSILPSGWYNASGIPYQMTFGWVGSTGGDDDVHEVNLVQSGTISGTPPQLSATVADNASGAPPHDSNMDYTVDVSNASGAGTESDAITATATIPSGETPVNTGSGWSGGTGWSCSTAGQIVTCTDSGGLAAGAESSITIPVDVTAAGGSHLTDSVTVSSNDANPASASDTVVVAKVATSFTAAANPTSTTYGNTVQLSAAGLPSDAGGTVTFTSGGSTLCMTGTVSAGSASCTTAVLGAGTYPVTATYSGDSSYLGSTATTSFVINHAGTSFTASPNPSSTTYGNTVQLHATGLPSNAAGTVIFTSGGSTLCTTGTVSAGSAACTTAQLTPATYPVTATYSGDSNYVGSTATTSFTITQASTSFTAAANPTSTAYGNTVNLSVSGLPSGATGTVTFTSGGSTLCATGAISLGSAACSTAALAANTYPVTATYSGDSNYQGSHATTSFTVTPDPVLHLSTSGTPSGAAAGTTYPLTLVPSLGGSPAGSAYHNPVLTATLPSGETFAAAPTATGWSCALSGGSTVLTCISTLAPITAGTPLASVTATVDISSSASGSLETTASLTDSPDQATTASATATVGVTAPPALSLTASGTPSGAAAGSHYTLTLSPAVGSSGGTAYTDPTLTATLPSGETFAAAPTPIGWSCALNGSSTVLTCTSTLAPITAGTPLATITATVDISSSASGSLQTTASLVDSTDLATTASVTATVGVTAPPLLHVTTSGTPPGAAAGTTYSLTLDTSTGSSGGAAYNDLTLYATLPTGETFATAPSISGWSCALSGFGTVLTCNSTAAPILAGTALAAVTATVDISSSASGSLQTTAALADSADAATTVSTTATVSVTAPPVLHIATSGTPSGAAAGTTYGLTLVPSLGGSPSGPAYHDPILTATLPSGETFAAAPSVIGWSCALSSGDTVLTCISTAAPIPAGTSLADLTATVDIASSAAGSLQTSATLVDSADLATAGGATATVDVTATPGLHIATSGTPSGAASGTHYGLTLSPSLGSSPAGPAYNDPTLTATLPSGETFASAPTATGWSCALSGGSTVLTCTSTLGSIPAGTTLAPVTATVDIASSATGSLQTTTSLADSADLAAAANATATVDITPDPVLDISSSGTPPDAAAGSSYGLTLSSSLGAFPAGPAYHDPVLTATLPSGETFTAAPVATGWSCALSAGGTVLTCNSILAPIPAGTSLSAVTATVDVGSSASGSLQTTASLADSSDAATTASTTATVDVTATPVLDIATSGTPSGAAAGTSYSLTESASLAASPAGPAYGDPTLTVILPAGETFAGVPTPSGWSCGLSSDHTYLSCTSSAAPIAVGTALAGVTATVDIASSSSGTLVSDAYLADSADAATPVSTSASVDVTGPPVLDLSTSGTPAGAAAGTSYSLTLSSALGSAGGPAYNDPILTTTLPTGENFAAAPTVTGWSCALSGGGTVLTCTSTAAPIPAGTSFADLTATVDIVSSAAGSLQTSATLVDSADLATAGGATATVDVTATPVLHLATSGTPSSASSGTHYGLTLSPSMGGSPDGPAYNDPTLTATLPSGETFAAAPTATGWSCALSGGSTVLTCTSTLGSIPAGTPLAPVAATVDIAPAATGSLATGASLADSADLATAAIATATVDVTADPVLGISSSGTPPDAAAGSSYALTLSSSLGASGGPAYNGPTLAATLPPGETFAAAPNSTGWSCSLSVRDTVLTCTSNLAPIAAGTALPDVTAAVDIASTARGTLQTTASLSDLADAAATAITTALVDPTATPVLAVSTSGTPTTAPAGSVYTLNVNVALAAADGPAYNEPTVTLVLPTGETLAAAPSISGWDCVLSADSTTLTCTRVAATPIDPGTQLLSLSVQVQVSSDATGELITTVSAGDTVDGATLAVTAARVGIPVATPATGAMPRAASPWGLGVLLAIAGFLLILGEEVERRFRSSAGRG
jgi:hypothetical protein